MSNDNTESPRSFSHFFSWIAEGDAHQEASEVLQRVVSACLREARARKDSASGSIEIKLSISADQRGHAEIGYSVRGKCPEPRRPRGMAFITEGGNLAAENPRQPRLPGIREVGQAKASGLDDNK